MLRLQITEVVTIVEKWYLLFNNTKKEAITPCPEILRYNYGVVVATYFIHNKRSYSSKILEWKLQLLFNHFTYDDTKTHLKTKMTPHAFTPHTRALDTVIRGHNWLLGKHLE